jgi:putative membrane protein
MIGIIVYLLATGLSLFLVSKVLPGFKIKSYGTAVLCALVYTFVAVGLAFLMPLFIIPFAMLMLPAAILGKAGIFLFGFVIQLCMQTVLLVITDKLVDDFEIDTWSTAFIGAFLMSLFQKIFAFIL